MHIFLLLFTSKGCLNSDYNMRVVLLFVFISIIAVIAGSCSGNDEKQHLTVSVADFERDTAVINNIILKCLSSEPDDYDSSVADLKEAYKQAVAINYQSGAAQCLFQEAELHYRMNNYKAAMGCYNDARLLAVEINDVLRNAKCLERMGSLNLSLGDDNLALRQYYEALPLFEKSANKEGIAKVYNIVGVFKSSQDEYDSAISYFAKATKLNEETGNTTGIFHNKGNLAFMYFKMGKVDLARKVYLELVPDLIINGDSINISVIYYHLSMFAESAQQPDSVNYYLRKALKISEKIADTSLLTTLYGRIGQIHLENNRYDSARIYLNKSFKTANAIDDYVTMKQSLKLLVAIDTLTGNYRQAVSKFAKMLIATDSVSGQKIRNNLEATELKYENQKKANLIEIQNIKLELAVRQKLLLIILFSFSVVVIILLTLLLFVLKRNNKRKNQLLVGKLTVNELQLKNAVQTEEIQKLKIENAEQELRIKENELVSNALAIEQKNEMLGLISNKINEAMAGDGNLNIKDLNGLVSAIKIQLNETDIFNQKFNQIHHNFFEKLKNLHPELSKSELKFCAYLKLHLDSNQISAIMNVTNEAIRKTRYRIRKKLRLAQDESLEDYIRKY